MTMHVRDDLAVLPELLPERTAPGRVRLHLNELSAGPLPSVMAVIRQATSSVHRYPDPSATELRVRLAQHLDVEPNRIAVGCGSTSLCQQLIEATCGHGDEIITGQPSFEVYRVFARIAGAHPRLVATAGHRLDLDAMASAITRRTRLIFVCNPNNPTGTAVGREALLRFLDVVPPPVMVVLDEAYREFVTDPEVPDGLRLVGDQANLAVLRTFSKAYGLAGLRVGYAVASPEVATALYRVGVPFAVSTVAQSAAIASLDSAGELQARCAGVAAERERVAAELRRAGCAVPPSQANFVWLPLGRRAEQFGEHCERHRILVRTFPREGVRVTIGGADENSAFLAAARSFLDPASAMADPASVDAAGA